MSRWPAPIPRYLPGHVSAEKRPVCWLVERNAQLARNPGFGFAAAGHRFVLASLRAEEVTAELWGPVVAHSLRAMVLLSSITVRVLEMTGPDPQAWWLHAREPRVLAFSKATRLSLSGRQRWTGEVWAVPLKVTDFDAAKATQLGRFLKREEAFLMT